MAYNELLKQVADYATSFYTKQTNATLVYHNHTHTWEMIDTVNRITSGYTLEDRDRFIVFSATWLYDTGYFITGTGTHKDKSCGVASAFLKTIAVNEADIEAVQNCIQATRLPQLPKNGNEEILCDAVMYYLGTDKYADKSKLLRRETEALHAIAIPGNEWRERSISLMEEHHYFTDYCKINLTRKKIDNLEKLKRKQDEKSAKKALPVVDLNSLPVAVAEQVDMNEPVYKIKKEKKKDKKKEPVRGVETVFRISTANHQRLSSMADNKAHIMISVNSIIISVVIGLVLRKTDVYQSIIIPTVLLLFVNVTTIIFSVLATRPRVPKGYFTKEQIEDKDVDLTFFGNFYKMEFRDYEYGMKEMMKNSDFLYGSLIRNVYGQAKVLGRKFALLRVSYTVFMVGLTAAVIAFVLVFIFDK